MTKMPEEVEERINKMTEAYRQRLIELWQWSNDEETDHPPTMVEIEDKIRKWIRQIGEDTQLLALEGMDRYRRKGKQSCPQCGEAVYWERYEGRNYITTLGEMELERAYYNHSTCHCGWVPLDERLGLGASELSRECKRWSVTLGHLCPSDKPRSFSRSTVAFTSMTIR